MSVTCAFYITLQVAFNLWNITRTTLSKFIQLVAFFFRQSEIYFKSFKMFFFRKTPRDVVCLKVHENKIEQYRL